MTDRHSAALCFSDEQALIFCLTEEQILALRVQVFKTQGQQVTTLESWRWNYKNIRNIYIVAADHWKIALHVYSNRLGASSLQTRPCHHVSQPVSPKRPKCASWLIRAGIQPPRLHLTICRRATYSIISCPTWRVSLSLTQAESEVSLYLLHKKPAGCTAGWARRIVAVGTYIYTVCIYLRVVNEARVGHLVAALWQERVEVKEGLSV